MDLIMPEIIPEEPKLTSTLLASEPSLFPVWDPKVPFPAVHDMLDPAVVTHITVERAKSEGYHYLHEATIAYHRGIFYAAFANHRTMECGDYDELIRGCTSPDAIHWTEPEIWVQAPMIGGDSHNHPLLVEHNDTLYGFFVCWREEHYPTTELFTLNDETGKWVYHPESAIHGFVPFCTPQYMSNGNWVLGGEHHWYEAAVAISDGDDFTKWKMIDIPRPGSIKLKYPECAVVSQGNRLLVVCRPSPADNVNVPGGLTAPVSESFDYGRTWTPLTASNFPLAPSQPFSGRLSTGQNYLLTNSLEDERTLLSIAVTGPEGGLFRKIFTVRRTQWPAIRYFRFMDRSCVGQPTQLAYPGAIELNSNLYIIYSQGKEDCALTIIPVEALLL
jgi:hypothetical protein